jgi:glycosyltransferase involved in cell wall biosynthesis
MLAYTLYEFDARVRRYAETLAKRGDDVDVIALGQNHQPPTDIIQGVHLFRIQRRTYNEKARLSYLLKLLLFFLRSTLFLTKRQLQHRYDLIHVHSVPDFEVFAAWLPKLMGSRIILDIHDLVPEFYASKFNVTPRSMIFKLLAAIEWLSAAFADHVIVANDIWRKRLTERSTKESKCTAILNFPDRSVFFQRGRKRNGRKFTMLYPGTLNYHQGVDVAIRAFALIKDAASDAEFHIYGRGPARDSLAALIAELRLEGRVFLKECVATPELATIMENSDLGVVPKRKTPFANEAFSTKILEFMAQGVPVLVSDTLVDRHYFNESLVKFFRGEEERDLADSMLLLFKDEELRHRLAENAGAYVDLNNWDVKKELYLGIVDSLTRNRKGQEAVVV